MAGHDPKIANPFVRKQLFAKQTRCIFNKDRVCGVEFGKRLLIFALHHDLGFCWNGAAAGLDQVLEPHCFGVWRDYNRNPCDGALGMRRCQLSTCRAGVFSQFQRTGAG